MVDILQLALSALADSAAVVRVRPAKQKRARATPPKTGLLPIPVTVPCTCGEKPYPHSRHFDGTGPGSGRSLK